MNKVYYAHSGNEPSKSDWQTLPDHLKEVGRIAAENARYFDAYRAEIDPESGKIMFESSDRR